MDTNAEEEGFSAGSNPAYSDRGYETPFAEGHSRGAGGSLGGEATKDVDAFALLSSNPPAVRTAARRIAASLNLPEDWLNEGAKGYLQGLSPGEILFQGSGLTVRAMAPQQLLAMKLSAWRDDVDIADARLLLSKLPGDRDQVWSLIEPHIVPGRELKARYAFEDLWESDREHP